VKSESWESDKTRLVTSWIVNVPKVADLARNFVKSNPDAPVIYRAWLKVEGKKIVETPKGNDVLNLKLHFGQLSEVLHSPRWD
jgi:hypothetical protein